MSLYAIADTHLSLGSDKPMDVFPGWENYLGRLEGNWRRLVTDADTVVIAGDISWAMTLEKAKDDFAFLQSLPGNKLLLKGNHDYWWTTKRKMETFLSDCGFDTLRIVHNSAEVVGEVAVCGTRGWFYDAEEDADKKILLREVGRLNLSIDAAVKTGKEPVVFLHYPPVCGNDVCRELLDVLLNRNIRLCYYGHLHGQAARKSTEQQIDGLRLQCISCDAVGFVPVLVR